MTELHPKTRNLTAERTKQEALGHENLDIDIADPEGGKHPSPTAMCWHCGPAFKAGVGSTILRRGEDVEEQHRGENDGDVD